MRAGLLVWQGMGTYFPSDTVVIQSTPTGAFCGERLHLEIFSDSYYEGQNSSEKAEVMQFLGEVWTCGTVFACCVANVTLCTF